MLEIAGGIILAIAFFYALPFLLIGLAYTFVAVVRVGFWVFLPLTGLGLLIETSYPINLIGLPMIGIVLYAKWYMWRQNKRTGIAPRLFN